MTHCKDCKFWNRNGEGLDYYEPDEDGVADYSKPLQSSHRRCLRVLHFSGFPEHSLAEPTMPACVTDGSGYAASLITLPSFGCELGESR